MLRNGHKKHLHHTWWQFKSSLLHSCGVRIICREKVQTQKIHVNSSWNTESWGTWHTRDFLNNFSIKRQMSFTVVFEQNSSRNLVVLCEPHLEWACTDTCVDTHTHIYTHIHIPTTNNSASVPFSYKQQSCLKGIEFKNPHPDPQQMIHNIHDWK